MKKTTFIYAGDAEPDKFKEQDGYRAWRSLICKAYAMAYGRLPDDPSFKEKEGLLVLGGDLIRRSRKENRWDAFFVPAGDILKNTSVIAAIGNHDCRNGIEYLDRFDLPENGPAGFEKRFYSCDYGSCHFAVLDTNVMWDNSEYPDPRTGIPYKDNPNYKAPDIAPVPLVQDWLVKDFAAAGTRPIFVVMHHPMFSPGISIEDGERAAFMREHFLPVMKAHNVKMILCGHQHFYCRTDPDKTGIIQLMGVSGNKLFKGKDITGMACVRELTPAATAITVNEEGDISLKTIDPEGNIIDEM